MTLTAPKHKRFYQEDIDWVKKALEQQELWPYPDSNQDPKSTIWGMSIDAIQNHYHAKSGRQLRAVAASSGTSAIHVALGGLQIPAGTEVIVPPITDMGTIMPVIFQNCIPVFADLDPETGLLSAETIGKRITERTSAVIVVHLMGSPPDMDSIMDLCRQHGIKVIEDAAQALGATYKGQPLGTIGDAGAFSLNSQKHITAGEGGFVLVEGEELQLRCLGFSDKYRRRLKPSSAIDPSVQDELKSYAAPGLNYRMSDLEHALLLSQMKRLDSVAAQFRTLGEHLEKRMESIDGIEPQTRPAGSTSTYFYVMGKVSKDLATKRYAIFEAVKQRVSGKDNLGVRVDPSYVWKQIQKFSVFTEKNFFANQSTPDSPEQLWPGELVARRKYPTIPDTVFDYAHEDNDCPEAQQWIDRSLLFRFHEGHEIAHMDAVADVLEEEIQKHR